MAGRLKDDYREICPHFLSFNVLYSVAFILLYPIGIPLAMNLACRRNGIVNIVKEKMDRAKFHGMISLFIKDSTSIEAHRVARLINGEEQEFESQTKRQFEKMCQKQGGGDVIVVDKLIQTAEHDHGAEGTTIQDLCKFFMSFDADGDGCVDLAEFQNMVRASYDASNLFMGSEEAEKLSERQIEALLMYEWPQKHEGIGDVDEFQGVGGLLYQMKKEMNQTSEDKSEEHQHNVEERKRHIEQGDRNDPQLIELDNLAQELEELEHNGQLTEAAFDTDWRTDLGHGEELYVDNPDAFELFLKRLHIRKLNKNQRREKLKELTHQVSEKVCCVCMLVAVCVACMCSHTELQAYTTNL